MSVPTPEELSKDRLACAFQTVEQADVVIAAIYVVPSAGKAVMGGNGLTNSVALPNASAALLNGILGRAATKTVVLAMGNPYLAQDFPAVQNYLCAFSSSSVSEISAAKALFAEIPIRGHLPVTIPEIAQRGFGIERVAQPAPGGTPHAVPKTIGH
jgi:beta-N-acetylhexosaminidase